MLAEDAFLKRRRNPKDVPAGWPVIEVGYDVPPSRMNSEQAKAVLRFLRSKYKISIPTSIDAVL
jgi:hypothetical protein